MRTWGGVRVHVQTTRVPGQPEEATGTSALDLVNVATSKRNSGKAEVCVGATFLSSHALSQPPSYVAPLELHTHSTPGMNASARAAAGSVCRAGDEDPQGARRRDSLRAVATGRSAHSPLSHVVALGSGSLGSLTSSGGAGWRQGSDPNNEPYKSRGAMRNAAREGNLEMLNVLLDAGADPNLCDAQGSYAPLHQFPPACASVSGCLDRFRSRMSAHLANGLSHRTVR